MGMFMQAVVFARPNDPARAVMHVTLKVMDEMRKEGIPCGIPTYISFDNRTLMLYPAPDKNMELRLRYFPPAVEI